MATDRQSGWAWRRRRPLLLLPLAIAFLAPTATGTLSVGASIVSKCSISASTFAFGSYDPIVTYATSPLNVSAGALSVSCTRGASGVNVSLDAGSNSSHAIGTTRAMASGGNYLSYELYTNTGMTTVWNTTNTVSYAPTSMAASSLTVYGQIPAAQDATVGSYTDSVTATVNF